MSHDLVRICVRKLQEEAMTKDEEDAMVDQFAGMTYALATRPPKESVTHAIRLAIRAAVAAEMERCAKVCEAVAEGLAWSDKDALNGARDCADAIRRGE